VTDGDQCETVQTIDIFDCSLSVSGLTLVRERNGGDVAPLADGAIINLDTLCSFNIRADICNSPDGSIQFLLNGNFFNVENEAPFALAGDNHGSYHQWTPAPGNYTLIAIPYSGPDATGGQGRPLTTEFTLLSTGCALKTLAGEGNDDGFALNVYPVPFENHIMVELQVAETAKGDLRIADMTGREVIRQSLKLFSGTNAVSVSMGSQTPAGVYLMEVRIKGEARVVKLIKI
jgi:hypothetical protein